MIERVILNVNDKVYSFLNPSFVTMNETPLSVAEGGFRQCIINPRISFEFACAIAEDIKIIIWVKIQFVDLFLVVKIMKFLLLLLISCETIIILCES